MTTTEPEWDEAERQWAHALRGWRESVLCPCGCGYPKSVAWDPATEWTAKAGLPVRCHVRTAIARGQRAWRKDNPDGEADGLLWGVEFSTQQTDSASSS